MTKNTFIACATGYDWAKLWPFVVSARKHAPDARIVLLVHGNDADTLNQLQEYGCELVPVEPHHPWVPAWMDPHVLLDRWKLPEMHVVCWRFAAIYCVLRSIGHTFGRVILTDIRDVLMVGDPFAFAWDENRACLVNECEAMKHGACPYNSVGMERMDAHVARELADAPIVCSGVVVGYATPLMAFLEKMIDCFTWAPTDRMLTDQVISRWCAEKFPAMVRVYGSAETPVLHAGYFKAAPPPVEGKALLHQLDRFPALEREWVGRLT